MSFVVRLIVAYDGTELSGWQRQPNTTESVQQKLEEALARIEQRPVSATASGRTDAGVHALGQAVHLGPPEVDVPLRSLVLGSNAYLPPGIRVLRADRMPTGFHARKCAASKLYRYRWTRARVVLPQEARYVAPARASVDVGAMREAAARLAGRHDFSAFAKSGGAHQQGVRTVTGIELLELGDELRLEVRGDGFLRGMVRAIAGTLMEVGQGRRAPGSIDELLGGDGEPPAAREASGPNAPACGLTLVEVDYDAPWQPLDEGFPSSDR